MGGWVADRRLASEFQAARDGAISTVSTGSGVRGRAALGRPARARGQAAAIDRCMFGYMLRRILRNTRRGPHTRRRVFPMLYVLLYPLHAHYVGFNVLRYETFRSVLAGLAALALALAAGPRPIRRFRPAPIGPTTRAQSPLSHQKKAGTPTMGPLLILSTPLIAPILFAHPTH